MSESVLPASAKRIITRHLWLRLERGDAVWSDAYGLGKFREHYDDEQGIVQFAKRRVRLRFGSDELYLVTATKQPKRRLKSVTIDGERMGIKRFVATQATTFGHDHATLNEAADIIGITRYRLDGLIARHGLKIKRLGTKQYLHRNQIKQIILRMNDPEQAEAAETASAQQPSLFSK